MAVAASQAESDAPSRRQRLVMACVCFGLFLAVYVLSAGPMVWLHRKLKLEPFETALETVYAPLIWLVRSRVEPFASLLKWYIEFFD